jgi:hypothetical protein
MCDSSCCWAQDTLLEDKKRTQTESRNLESRSTAESQSGGGSKDVDQTVPPPSEDEPGSRPKRALTTGPQPPLPPSSKLGSSIGSIPVRLQSLPRCCFFLRVVVVAVLGVLFFAFFCLLLCLFCGCDCFCCYLSLLRLLFLLSLDVFAAAAAVDVLVDVVDVIVAPSHNGAKTVEPAQKRESKETPRRERQSKNTPATVAQSACFHLLSLSFRLP